VRPAYRPSIVRFVAGAVLGTIASLSISFGLVSLVAAFVGIVLFAVLSRSASFLAGSLVGWGAAWLFLVGRTYVDCVSRVPDCDPGGSFAPLIIVAAAISVAGGAIAIIGVVRIRGGRSVL
jgi:hypothetical protein